MVVKLFAFSRRLGDLTMREFHAHWLDIHARQIADDPSLRQHVRRYELIGRLESADGSDDAEVTSGWDGAATLDFNSLADFEAMQAEPSYGEHADDGQHFREERQLAAFTNGPHVIVPAADPDRAPVRSVSVVTRNSAVSREQFRPEWLEHEQQLYRGPSPTNQLVLGYVQWQVIDMPGATCDGVAEHWFSSIDHFREWRDAGSHPIHNPDLAHLIDHSSVEFIVAGMPTVVIAG